MTDLKLAEPGARTFDYNAAIERVAKRIDSAMDMLNKHDHSSGLPATFTRDKTKTYRIAQVDFGAMQPPEACPMCGKPCDSSKVTLGGSETTLYGCTCVADKGYVFDPRSHWAVNVPYETRPPKPISPLDVEYDGVKLRTLIDGDAFNRQEQGRGVWKAKAMTFDQRAAVSAHWSAQLRARIAASKSAEVQRERDRITCDPRDTLDLE